MAWRAEAEVEKDRRLGQLRRFWLLIVAAVVLLPPYLLGVLAAGAAAVYIGVRAVTGSVGAPR